MIFVNNKSFCIAQKLYKYRPGFRQYQNVLDQVVAVDGCYKSRGIKATTTLAECKNTSAPATLLEVAFHDNKDDAAWIINKMDDIANAIANGIDAYA